MQVKHFDELESEFIQRVHTMVWCNVATVDSQQRPRSRLLHPIWEGATGWIGTHRNSYKSKHLAQNPYVSPSVNMIGVRLPRTERQATPGRRAN